MNAETTFEPETEGEAVDVELDGAVTTIEKKSRLTGAAAVAHGSNQYQTKKKKIPKGGKTKGGTHKITLMGGTRIKRTHKGRPFLMTQRQNRKEALTLLPDKQVARASPPESKEEVKTPLKKLKDAWGKRLNPSGLENLCKCKHK